MIQFIKNLLGLGPSVNYAALVNEGALIIDVRTKAEYAGGHIKGSTNIPLDQLNSKIPKMKEKGTPIITCCASGARSAAAKNILKQNQFTQVYNGGAWRSLNQKIRSGSK